MWYVLPFYGLRKLEQYAIDARRRDRGWRYLAWSALAGVIAGSLLGAVMFLTWWLLSLGLWMLAVIIVAGFGVPLTQPALVRHVVVPLGWTRLAYMLGKLDADKDNEAYALCAAAWAHAHRPDATTEAWLTRQRDKRVPLGDGEVAVTALLAAGRGDTTTARNLLRSLVDLVEVHARVRELAGEWLACDAAERAAWHELHADAAAARWPATPLTYLLEGIAARRVGASEAPSRRELWARWLLAPHRRVTARLLADVVERRAPAVGADGGGGGGGEVVAPAAPAMPRAIAAHLAAITAPRGAAASAFTDAVTAWDAALGDAALREWIARRAFELDAPADAAERVVHDVAQVVTEELARVADAAQLAAPVASGTVGGPLARRLRHGRLDALEAGFQRWDERRRSGDPRAPIDEWREFVALRGAYDAIAAAGGNELRRLAFPHAYSVATSISVWLWNARKEYAVSHAISTWLLGEAMAVGDTQAIDTSTQNTRFAVPTRLGKFVPRP